MLSNQIGNLANKLNPNLELGVQFGDVRNNLLNAKEKDSDFVAKIDNKRTESEEAISAKKSIKSL